MKRLLSSVLAAVSLSAFAAWERIGSLQVADMATQGDAIARLGSYMGNPLAAAGMAAAIADMPTIKFFGPMRPKTPMAFVLYWGAEDAASAATNALGCLEYAFLYPMSISKAEFLKRHDGAVETNGVVFVKGGVFDDSDTYVVFSPDGKWAGASDKVEQATLALAEIALAEKPLAGDALRLRLDEKAFAKLGEVIGEAESKAEAEGVHVKIDKQSLDVLKAVRAFACGIRVSDAGIDLRGSTRFAKDSEAASFGLKPLAANALAFAGRDAVSASAWAEDSGMRGMSGKDWDDLFDIFKRNGADLSRFISRAALPGGDKFTVDFAAIMKAVKETTDKGEDAMEKMSGKLEKVVEELVPRFGSTKCSKGPAYACAVSLKGVEPQWPVAERFAETLPEAAGKPVSAVWFYSLSSILRAAASEALVLVPEEQRAVMKPMLDQFCAETKRGVAGMLWQKDGAQRFFFRISADEFRTVGSRVSSAMMFGVSSSVQAVEFDDGDEDED
ncbi:MAG: hypothetical protein IJ829_05590 [Kiritimatiellae bacterium]|nr:hypothetical protein [Kiritimatiellia bacterium]